MQFSRPILAFAVVLAAFASARHHLFDAGAGGTVDAVSDSALPESPLSISASRSEVARLRAADLVSGRMESRPRSVAPGGQLPEQLESITILDPDEGGKRIDIGDAWDVETVMEEDLGIELLIGSPVDADDPLAWSEPPPADSDTDVGVSADADASESWIADDSETSPVLLGEPRDADPLADALWVDSRRAASQVQDIGQQRLVPGETIAPKVPAL